MPSNKFYFFQSIHGRGEGCRTAKHDNDDGDDAQDTLEVTIRIIYELFRVFTSVFYFASRT